MKTRITDILNIKYPIIQGGMAWVADASLAAAVSNAGGLGIITSIFGGPEAVRAEIQKCKQLTDKPFGVNLMLQDPNTEIIAQIVIEEKVPVVTTGAGSPAKYMPAWLEAGIKVIPVLAAPAHAIRMERIGACAVIAEGGESGGHIGEMNTMALVPQICDAVSIPVIAAGGIADGRGLAAAFMLGAEGVQCGTCFLVAEECTIHDNYKQKVVKAAGTDTAVTGKTLGHPVRAIKSPFTRNFAEMEKNPNSTPEEIMAFGAGSLRKAAREGNEAEGSFMAGQSAGLANEIRPAKDIIESMVKQAEEVMAQQHVR
ncbi:MAG: nitronate monooxygenase [Bacteroidales bacterium]|nr:nitronate monooxygenase [Bacteroidales bacterium]MBO5977839.1 nitronate monooxygenase [Bacteroidales bacterium]MBO7269941.1 nitronate monooxygenase [Bacteroidales bacterium]MBQ2447418.1 nitronate monooxygenase [Bacteroidales bacterium]MBQ5605306.1 nitronate monooxygenase [Bacteroidales bacterium]